MNRGVSLNLLFIAFKNRPHDMKLKVPGAGFKFFENQIQAMPGNKQDSQWCWFLGQLGASGGKAGYQAHDFHELFNLNPKKILTECLLG